MGPFRDREGPPILAPGITWPTRQNLLNFNSQLINKEKQRILKATMNTVHDRVGNALFGIKMILGDGAKNNRVDEALYDRVVAVIDTTVEELEKLSSSKKIEEKRFDNDIYFLEIEK